MLKHNASDTTIVLVQQSEATKYAESLHRLHQLKLKKSLNEKKVRRRNFHCHSCGS
jgi:hypothetical protein